MEKQETLWFIKKEIPHLRRFARSLSGDATSADDLVQDTLERALRKHKKWSPEKGSMRVWLFKMMQNIFINKTQKQKRQGTHIDVTDLPGTTHDTPQRREMSQDERVRTHDVLRSFGHLPEEQRHALTLVAIEGLRYEDAAQVLGVAIGTVRSRVARARTFLRVRHLKEGHPDVVPLTARNANKNTKKV